jgi:hypothetical protein
MTAGWEIAAGVTVMVAGDPLGTHLGSDDKIVILEHFGYFNSDSVVLRRFGRQFSTALAWT